MNRAPWVLTETEAAIRDAQADVDAARAFQAVWDRVVVPGMSDDAIKFRLARCGYTAAQLKKLWPSLVRLQQAQERAR